MNQSSKKKSVKSIGQIVLLLSFVCVLATCVPYLISIPRGDEEWEYILPFAFAVFGVLPAGIIFFLIEEMLKKIFNFRKTKLSNQLAIFYGLIVGTTVVTITLLLLWKTGNSDSTLSEFLFLPKNTKFYFGNFELRVNPFLMLLILNVISSPYMGWKINKDKSVETTSVIKD